jgi:hypothetical protein
MCEKYSYFGIVSMANDPNHHLTTEIEGSHGTGSTPGSRRYSSSTRDG